MKWIMKCVNDLADWNSEHFPEHISCGINLKCRRIKKSFYPSSARLLVQIKIIRSQVVLALVLVCFYNNIWSEFGSGNCQCFQCSSCSELSYRNDQWANIWYVKQRTVNKYFCFFFFFSFFKVFEYQICFSNCIPGCRVFQYFYNSNYSCTT